MLSKNKERKLIELYGHTDDATIAKILGVPLYVVRKKAYDLGLEKEKDSNWTKDQIDTLVKWYPEHSNDYIAYGLMKTKFEIEHFAFRLGLSKSPNYFSNIIITSKERELVKQWNDEYTSADNGYSRGNYVLGKILAHEFPRTQITSEYPIGDLRLDFCIPRLFLGFEFDGVQHYEYNSFFYKTKADFLRAKSRDYAKSEMCENLGIAIVRFTHKEDLSISLLKAKLQEVR
jgi:hypothetical protein